MSVASIWIVRAAPAPRTERSPAIARAFRRHEPRGTDCPLGSPQASAGIGDRGCRSDDEDPLHWVTRFQKRDTPPGRAVLPRSPGGIAPPEVLAAQVRILGRVETPAGFTDDGVEACGNKVELQSIGLREIECQRGSWPREREQSRRRHVAAALENREEGAASGLGDCRQ